MSEFITIQVGQCGNQIGNCFWKCAVQEYGIDLFHYNRHSNSQQIPKLPGMFESFSSFFCCPEKISYKKECLQALCIDMEDSVVARFRKGSLRGLFNNDCLLTNYPGSGNNWAEGFFSHGSHHYEDISERIRKAVECCDGLHGFLLLYSLGGGTGSGLGSRVLSLLEDQYPHIDSQCPQSYEEYYMKPHYQEHLQVISVLAKICYDFRLKKKVRFPSWNQDAVKVGMCSVAPPWHKLSALGLFNSSSLATLFEETSFQFNKLFRRRAHIHHYTKVDGFEIASFFESLEQLQDIAEAYKGLETHQPVIPHRFKVL
ncbi:Uncharacterized protein GBIM_08945 [Gryllus bimaculatus]|nr:Uncharacterized protein GBIM_08945 [Gryllus bimaculatus]